MLELFRTLPEGTGAIGIGAIMIGLNVARSLNGIPTSGFTATLGAVALVLGGLEFAAAVFALPFVVPVFPVLLIVFGVLLAARQL